MGNPYEPLIHRTGRRWASYTSRRLRIHSLHGRQSVRCIIHGGHDWRSSPLRVQFSGYDRGRYLWRQALFHRVRINISIVVWIASGSAHELVYLVHNGASAHADGINVAFRDRWLQQALRESSGKIRLPVFRDALSWAGSCPSGGRHNVPAVYTNDNRRDGRVHDRPPGPVLDRSVWGGTTRSIWRVEVLYHATSRAGWNARCTQALMNSRERARLLCPPRLSSNHQFP